MKSTKNISKALDDLAQVFADVQIAQPCQNKLRADVAQNAIKRIVKISKTVPLCDGIRVDLANAGFYSKATIIDDIKDRWSVISAIAPKSHKMLEAVRNSAYSYFLENDYNRRHSILSHGNLEDIERLVHNVADDLFSTLVESKLDSAKPKIEHNLKAHAQQ